MIKPRVGMIIDTTHDTYLHIRRIGEDMPHWIVYDIRNKGDRRITDTGCEMTFGMFHEKTKQYGWCEYSEYFDDGLFEI